MLEKKHGWTKELKEKTFYLPIDARPSERIFCLNNRLRERPKCKQCRQATVKFFDKKYRVFCSVKCSQNNLETQQKSIDACRLKFGVDNPSQDESIKKKKTETCKSNFGVEYPLQSEKIQKQLKNTNLKNFGIENTSQREDVKQKKRAGFLLSHGVENPFQSEAVKIKMRETWVKKYGVENPMQSQEIRDKSKQTCLFKYGVCHPLQDPAVLERNQKYRTKSAVIDGRDISYQGYEIVGWRHFLNNGFAFEDILSRKGDMPKFIFVFCNKTKRYFPDFYVPSKNLIVEIKSTWTMKKYFDLNLAKRHCVLEAGYNFQFWVCSDTKILEVL